MYCKGLTFPKRSLAFALSSWDTLPDKSVIFLPGGLGLYKIIYAANMIYSPQGVWTLKLNLWKGWRQRLP